MIRWAQYALGGLALVAVAYVGVAAAYVHGKSIPGLVACAQAEPGLATACRLSLAHQRPFGSEVPQLNREAGIQYVALSDLEGRAELITRFKAAGVQVDARDERVVTRWTALHLAALQPDAEATRLLLSQGADPMVRDAQGQTALALAERRRAATGDTSYDAVIAILKPVTRG